MTIKNKEETEYELPYVYYPGYKVTVDGIKINNYETVNGFVGFKIDDVTECTVEVIYTGTNIMKISYFISIAGFLALIIYIIKKH